MGARAGGGASGGMGSGSRSGGAFRGASDYDLLSGVPSPNSDKFNDFQKEVTRRPGFTLGSEGLKVGDSVAYYHSYKGGGTTYTYSGFGKVESIEGDNIGINKGGYMNFHPKSAIQAYTSKQVSAPSLNDRISKAMPKNVKLSWGSK